MIFFCFFFLSIHCSELHLQIFKFNTDGFHRTGRSVLPFTRILALFLAICSLFKNPCGVHFLCITPPYKCMNIWNQRLPPLYLLLKRVILINGQAYLCIFDSTHFLTSTIKDAIAEVLWLLGYLYHRSESHLKSWMGPSKSPFCWSSYIGKWFCTFKMRPRISIRGFVRLSVGPSVTYKLKT